MKRLIAGVDPLKRSGAAFWTAIGVVLVTAGNSDPLSIALVLVALVLLLSIVVHWTHEMNYVAPEA